MTFKIQENLTLSAAEVDACRPIPGEGGRALRAYCPFHQSDHQRSLRINQESGRFTCFACGAWGYTEHGRRDHASTVPSRKSGSPSLPPPPAIRREAPVRDLPSRSDLAELLEVYQAALPGSIGERYLRWRGISLELATKMGIGYAACGQWAHQDPGSGRPARQWKHGRLVFPHTDPEGRPINLYGRAIGADAVPKHLRHDHLPGRKGYFNASTLRGAKTPVYICEGPFDALSLMAAGATRVVAIFGIAGWRWDWTRDVSELIFAFDADRAGEQWKELAWQAVLRGKRASVVVPEPGCKDFNEMLVKGILSKASVRTD